MDVELFDITLLLDRSGSMSSIRNAVIEGTNSFLQDQRDNKHPVDIEKLREEKVRVAAHLGKLRPEYIQLESVRQELFMPLAEKAGHFGPFCDCLHMIGEMPEIFCGLVKSGQVLIGLFAEFAHFLVVSAYKDEPAHSKDND